MDSKLGSKASDEGSLSDHEDKDIIALEGTDDGECGE
jgi:hypothetical protein